MNKNNEQKMSELTDEDLKNVTGGAPQSSISQDNDCKTNKVFMSDIDCPKGYKLAGPATCCKS